MLRKTDVSAGIILRYDTTAGKSITALRVTSGHLHEGVFVQANGFTGTVAEIHPVDASKGITNVVFDGITGIPQVGSSYLAYSNLKIANISLLIELVIIFSIFFCVFKNVRFWNRFAIAAIALTIVWWLYRNILLDKLYSYGGAFTGGTTLLIIIFALYYFYQQLNNTQNPFIYASPAFWIISSILLYKASTFFLFLYVNTLAQNEKENYYVINSLFYILENILFTIAFVVHERKMAKNSLKDSRLK